MCLHPGFDGNSKNRLDQRPFLKRVILPFNELPARAPKCIGSSRHHLFGRQGASTPVGGFTSLRTQVARAFIANCSVPTGVAQIG